MPRNKRRPMRAAEAADEGQRIGFEMADRNAQSRLTAAPVLAILQRLAVAVPGGQVDADFINATWISPAMIKIWMGVPRKLPATVFMTVDPASCSVAAGEVSFVLSEDLAKLESWLETLVQDFFRSAIAA